MGARQLQRVSVQRTLQQRGEKRRRHRHGTDHPEHGFDPALRRQAPGSGTDHRRPGEGKDPIAYPVRHNGHWMEKRS